MDESKQQPKYLPVEPFTRRERDILRLLGQHLTSPEIAGELNLALSSVKWYVQQIYGKLGVNSRRQAIVHARELGLLESGEWPDGFPTAVLPPSPQHNLPRQLTRFIGREKDIAQIMVLVEDHALVTLTGSGGVGKTRLALQVAEEILARYPDGVWLAELAPNSDPGLLAQTVAAALGLREEANHPFHETLVDFLRSKQALIVLDNCEQLSEACARLAETLLHACPRVKLLASSRELLGVSGEMPYRVPSLDFPDPRALPDVSALQDYEAVRLFVERAQAALPGFQVTPQNSTAIAQICQRLDGIPLALELAAARLNVLTTEQLIARLDDAFHLLTGGSRTALPRHQTLRAAIDWSYQMLSQSEGLLLRRLSVFSGGWTLEAAEDICKDDALVLDLLSSLVNKSMVIAERKQGAETRYHLLGTVRQYAHEKLIEAGERQELSERYGQYFLQFAETGGHKMWSAEHLEWMCRLNADLDNLRATIQWSYADNRNIETGLRIAVAIGREFIQTTGLYNEARQWLLTGLDAWDPIPDRLLHARALNVLSGLNFMYSISTNDLLLLEESIQICRSIGPAANAELSWALMNLGMTLIILHEDWELETARLLMEEGVAVARQLEPGDHNFLAKAIGTLADLYLRRRIKNYSQIRRLAEENLQLRLQIGDRWSGGQAMWTLADFAEIQGDFEQARSYLEQALALYQEAEDKWGIELTHRNLGRFFLHQGEYPTAITYHQEYLRAWNAMGIRGRVIDGLRRLGVDQTYLGSSTAAPIKEAILSQAAKSLGAAEKLSENERLFATPADQEDYHKAVELLHTQLDPAVFDQAWAEGQVMALDDAVRFALSERSDWG